MIKKAPEFARNRSDELEDEERNRLNKRSKRINELIEELQLEKSRWSAYSLTWSQALIVLILFLLSIIIYLSSVNLIQDIDSGFIVSIFGALLSIGTFFPALLVALFERRLSTQSARLFWRGAPRIIVLTYVTVWSLTLYLVTSLAIINDSGTQIFGLDRSSLLLALSFLSISLIPFVLWVLFLRLQPKQFGQIAEITARDFIIRGSNFKLESLVDSYIRSALASISVSNKESLRERLISITKLATLDSKLSENIMDGLGWLAKKNIEDREVIFQIVDQIYALSKLELDNKTLQKDLERKAIQELWSVFEMLIKAKGSRKNLREIIEMLDDLIERSDATKRASFLRRYSEAAEIDPRWAGFVQKWTFEWLSKYPQMIIEAKNDNLDRYLEYLQTYDWKYVERDTRSTGFGLALAIQDFEQILVEARKAGTIRRERLDVLLKIKRSMKKALNTP